MEQELPEIDRKEVFRYLGYRGTAPDAQVSEAVERCIGNLREAVRPRTIWERYPLVLRDTCGLEFAGISVESRALRKNLDGCREVFLFAATLGIEADRLIARAQIGKISDAVILQAAAAAQIESVCDTLNEELRRSAAAEGMALRPRFSPGYGDFPLIHQGELLQVLQAQKRIGITLTEGGLMMPSKSVTAVIGIAETAVTDRAEKTAQDADIGTGRKHKKKHCADCGKTDCPYREAAAPGGNPDEDTGDNI